MRPATGSRLIRFTTGALISLVLAGLAPWAAAEERQLRVAAPDGVELAVQESGNPAGRPIVFIHGLLGSRINWTAQLKSPQLQRFRLITYDLRGHGLSDKPDNEAVYRDGKAWADDLAVVIQATGAQRPVLVGWSLGGVVISNYLATHGDSDLAGAVYVDGVIELKADQISPHPKVYAGLASQDLPTHLNAVRDFLRLCFQHQPDPSSFEQLLANAAMASWTMTRTVPSMTALAAEGLPKAQVPMLLIQGRHDALVMGKPSLARARELNPRVRTLTYENSGHAPFMEESARFNSDLLHFMKSAETFAPPSRHN
ncbi:alpha/beta hydrolase [Roseateles sp. SL47]|uniref:alpha/beta fold hydrolase n=1 Tax=Roseateles sp. SL47 TaxID=2995138 RepID=UPI00226DA1CB|nr:alpha/beta hydrolase [Roseateles sp. SL47]WAC71714.1 alpha/beta hydrolase [Roseateles sp. SL47]